MPNQVGPSPSGSVPDTDGLSLQHISEKPRDSAVLRSQLPHRTAELGAFGSDELISCIRF